MADFTPINTQAEFDAAIADRLSRQEKSLTANYEGYMSSDEVSAVRAGYDKTIAELQSAKEASDKQLTEALAKIKGYETDSVKTRIALETGLPYGMAARLAGETEDEIRKDAEALRDMMKPAAGAAPLASAEPKPFSGGTRDQFANWFGEQLGR